MRTLDSGAEIDVACPHPIEKGLSRTRITNLQRHCWRKRYFCGVPFFDADLQESIAADKFPSVHLSLKVEFVPPPIASRPDSDRHKTYQQRERCEPIEQPSAEAFHPPSSFAPDALASKRYSSSGPFSKSAN